MKRLLFIAALAAIAILSLRANAMPNKTDAIDETFGPTLVGTSPWADSSGANQFYYVKRCSLWFSPIPNAFILTGTTVTGAMGVWANAAACDTTSATPTGFMHPDSTCCIGIKWEFRKNSSPNCSLQVFVSTTGPQLKKTIDTSSGNSGTVTFAPVFAGANEPWSVYIKQKGTGPTNPDKPQVQLIWGRFWRVTTL
jgi:hypothetical protein